MPLKDSPNFLLSYNNMADFRIFKAGVTLFGCEIIGNTEWAKSRYTVYSIASSLCIPTFGPLCISREDMQL